MDFCYTKVLGEQHNRQRSATRILSGLHIGLFKDHFATGYKAGDEETVQSHAAIRMSERLHMAAHMLT